MISFLRCVVDASVGVKQFIPNPTPTKVNQLFDHLIYPETEIFVPDLFYVECANVLWKYIRAGLYAATDIPRDLTTLKNLPLHRVSTIDLVTDAVDISLNYEISVYDACYVALSEQVKATLLTYDRKLVNKLVGSSYNICLFDNFQIPPLPKL